MLELRIAPCFLILYIDSLQADFLCVLLSVTNFKRMIDINGINGKWKMENNFARSADIPCFVDTCNLGCLDETS
jgi:hypothetical protein